MSVSSVSSNLFSEYLKKNPGQVDAWDYVSAFLKDANLGNLTDWAQGLLVEYGDGLSDEMFLQRLRATDQYKVRFKAIEDRRKLGLPAISEADVINTEKAYTQIFQRAGLPPGFYDSPEDFTDFLVKDISPDELQTRVVDGFQYVQNAAPEVRAEFKRLGFGDGGLVAFWIDPDKTEAALKRQLNEAKLGATGIQTGYGQLQKTQAERLAQLEVTDQQARQGFSELASQSSLYQPLAGEQGSISRDEQLDAQFGGNDNARRRIQRRRQERQSGFQGGGGYEVNRTGETGVGSSNQ